jgi:small redox-active disulfide protein 2
MKTIQILGTGCPKCKKLFTNVQKAVALKGGDYTVVKVEDINEIIAFGVMSTPALAVDGQVKFFGKVLSPDDIVSLI